MRMSTTDSDNGQISLTVGIWFDELIYPNVAAIMENNSSDGSDSCVYDSDEDQEYFPEGQPTEKKVTR